jgi:hypothetical protein
LDINWISFFSAALSGGVVVKAIDLIYHSINSSSERKRTAKQVVDAHLDPLIKAADEIVGKTRSLAERDFSEVIKASLINGDAGNDRFPTQVLGLLYLYAQFWGRIEILRQDSLGISISSDKRGATLKEFLACLESQRIRLVDRVHQKAIGELAINLDENGKFRSIGLVDFSNHLDQDPSMRNWLQPLSDVVTGVRNKRVRQRVLVYGVVVHALIDTLDSDRHSSHTRPSYPNKLSKHSRNDIRFRVFGRYLKQVRDTRKYVG